MKTSPYFHLAGCAFLLLTVNWMEAPACGQAVDFTVDETRSTITASGKVLGYDVREQGEGSLTARFGGTIRAEVGPSTIRFPGGSMLDALTNGVWQPGAGGEAGSAPADFAGEVSTPLGFIPGAFRSLVLDIQSEELSITNGVFDASRLVFLIPTNAPAAFDYDAGFLGHGTRLLGGLATNKVVQGASLQVVGGVETLTITVDSEYSFRALQDNDSQIRLQGQIVAVRGGADLPRIGSVRVEGQQLVFSVQNLDGAPARVQSSIDLKTWADRTAASTNETSGTTFTLDMQGPIEFFRIVK